MTVLTISTINTKQLICTTRYFMSVPEKYKQLVFSRPKEPFGPSEPNSDQIHSFLAKSLKLDRITRVKSRVSPVGVIHLRSFVPDKSLLHVSSQSEIKDAILSACRGLTGAQLTKFGTI